MTDVQKVISAFAAWTLAIVIIVVFGQGPLSLVAVPIALAGGFAFVIGVA